MPEFKEKNRLPAYSWHGTEKHFKDLARYQSCEVDDVVLMRVGESDIADDWLDQLRRAAKEQSLVLHVAPDYGAGLAEIKQILERLTESLSAIAEDRGSATAPINTLSPEPFEIVVPPLFVSLCPSDGEYVASLYEAGVATTGETKQEAIAHLIMMIVDVYRSLTENEHRLTEESSRRLAVLRGLIRPKREGEQVG